MSSTQHQPTQARGRQEQDNSTHTCRHMWTQTQTQYSHTRGSTAIPQAFHSHARASTRKSTSVRGVPHAQYPLIGDDGGAWWDGGTPRGASPSPCACWHAPSPCTWASHPTPRGDPRAWTHGDAHRTASAHTGAHAHADDPWRLQTRVHRHGGMRQGCRACKHACTGM